MNIDTLIDILFDAYVADADILSWCNTNYSTPQTLYKGIDLRQPPPETDYPIIHIWPINKNEGHGYNQVSHDIGVMVGVFDSTQTSTTDTNDIVSKKYRGVARLEAFRKLVETSTTTEIDSNTETTELFVDNLEITYEIVDSFPFFLAAMMFTITKKYSQGDDIFE